MVVVAIHITKGHIHLCCLFPLITFVVNMMYLQIIYQCEVLQMLKVIKQKGLQLACKQVRYASRKIPYGVYNLY